MRLQASGETGNGPWNLFNPSLHFAETFIAPTSCKMSSHLGLGFKALPYGVLPSSILNLPKSVLSPTKWVYYMVSRACQHPPQHSLLVIPALLSLLLHTPAWSDLLFPWPVPAGLRIYNLGQFCKSFMLTFHTFISCLYNYIIRRQSHVWFIIACPQHLAQCPMPQRSQSAFLGLFWRLINSVCSDLSVCIKWILSKQKGIWQLFFLRLYLKV